MYFLQYNCVFYNTVDYCHLFTHMYLCIYWTLSDVPETAEDQGTVYTDEPDRHGLCYHGLYRLMRKMIDKR